METKKKITLDDVLIQFNPYHDGQDKDGLNAAITANSEKRETFNDLLINAMASEHEVVDEWDNARRRGMVSFAQDFNNFLRSLDNYYKQQRNKLKN